MQRLHDAAEGGVGLGHQRRQPDGVGGGLIDQRQQVGAAVRRAEGDQAGDQLGVGGGEGAGDHPGRGVADDPRCLAGEGADALAHRLQLVGLADRVVGQQVGGVDGGHRAHLAEIDLCRVGQRPQVEVASGYGGGSGERRDQGSEAVVVGERRCDQQHRSGAGGQPGDHLADDARVCRQQRVRHGDRGAVLPVERQLRQQRHQTVAVEQPGLEVVEADAHRVGVAAAQGRGELRTERRRAAQQAGQQVTVVHLVGDLLQGGDPGCRGAVGIEPDQGVHRGHALAVVGTGFDDRDHPRVVVAADAGDRAQRGRFQAGQADTVEGEVAGQQPAEQAQRGGGEAGTLGRHLGEQSVQVAAQGGGRVVQQAGELTGPGERLAEQRPVGGQVRQVAVQAEQGGEHVGGLARPGAQCRADQLAEQPNRVVAQPQVGFGAGQREVEGAETLGAHGHGDVGDAGLPHRSLAGPPTAAGPQRAGGQLHSGQVERPRRGDLEGQLGAADQRHRGVTGGRQVEGQQFDQQAALEHALAGGGGQTEAQPLQTDGVGGGAGVPAGQ